MALENNQQVFQAIADPTRREIIEHLIKQQMTITTLRSNFSISRQALTKHIEILESSGLIISRIHGRERWLVANMSPLRGVEQWVTYYSDLWDKALSSLGDHLSKTSE